MKQDFGNNLEKLTASDITSNRRRMRSESAKVVIRNGASRKRQRWCVTFAGQDDEHPKGIKRCFTRFVRKPYSLEDLCCVEAPWIGFVGFRTKECIYEKEHQCHDLVFNLVFQ
ncbi:unnamed protein product [Arabidopsis thaliana]|uniref:Uncharacterized protein n=1 Tax=Arabidopsis thaliana TaxID=3702 RepID=A0A654ETM0_ARATH|nr:unnamed protein product [Arabidopsis thaliana]